jgi:hypothetical protein
MRRILTFLKYGIPAALILIQLVPVDRTNPPVTRELRWDTEQTRAIAERACFDCHSNQTKWPWYAYVAPVSWRLADHVEHGREHMNFSEWGRPNEDFEEVEEVLKEGEMPLSDYLRLHPEARLTPEETSALLEGLRASFAQDPPIERPRQPPGHSEP